MKKCPKCQTGKEEDEFRKVSGKIIFSECRSCYNKTMNNYYKNNDNYRKNMLLKMIENSLNAKLDVMKHYSNGTPKCECCGITEIRFLSIDHIRGNGKDDRKRGLHGAKLCKWIRKNNYPEGFRILCFNCNFAIGIHGFCPHNKEKHEQKT